MNPPWKQWQAVVNKVMKCMEQVAGCCQQGNEPSMESVAGCCQQGNEPSMETVAS